MTLEIAAVNQDTEFEGSDIYYLTIWLSACLTKLYRGAKFNVYFIDSFIQRAISIL